MPLDAPDSESLGVPSKMTTWTERPTAGGIELTFGGAPVELGPRVLAYVVLACGALFACMCWGSPESVTSPIAYYVGPVLVVVGALLLLRWRKGAPARGVIRFEKERLRIGRFDVARSAVQDVMVRRQSQQVYSTTAVTTATATYDWYQVILITNDNRSETVACFGDLGCADFMAARLLELAKVPPAPERPYR